MTLEIYRKKRNFRATPEPAGRVGKRRQKGLAFVIQKHAASRLHYDFRLELNGVLRSWAVPKGPSLDPNDKRLAMHVEDHPLEYGDFEGVIPAKQYGSGTVLLWDRGAWIPKEDPEAGFKKGKLKFVLDGEKLHGGWTLVRSHGGQYGNGGKEAWLLIKEDDEFAQPSHEASVVQEHPMSVASGRSLEEIAADADRVWHSNKSVAENVKRGATSKPRVRSHGTEKLRGAVKAALPAFVRPELAALVDAPPAGENWLHEMKYDGYRILSRIEGGEARLYSRNGKEWTGNFPTIARAAARLPVKTAWVDGEVVVIQADGRSSFQALQNALSRGSASALQYYVFDLPYLDGYDLRRVPLVERKGALARLIATKRGTVRLSEHIQGSGPQYYEEACSLKLEGIVCKRAESLYQAGRGRNWVKVKCELRQEAVIGGYTDPEGSRTAFGALLLGVYDEDGGLRYCGKVGTGFNVAMLKSLKKRFDPLEQKDPPFVNPPKGAEARRAHWVKPELVAEVRFTEWTNDGTLRHPSFQGLREDKKASEVVRERPASTEEVTEQKPRASDAARKAAAGPPDTKRAAGDTIAGIQLSNAAKMLYPEAKIAKRDLAQYYEAVCEWLLPHLKDRPLTLVRCPNGWNKPCFFQKNADDNVSEAIERVTVQTSEGAGRYMMANSLAAVVALVQMGVLEIHPWGSTRRKLECPDRVIFDFDPDDDLPWGRLVDSVHLMKTLLEEIGLHGFLKTTGGKGLHVVVPIRPTMPWDQVKGFSRAIAELLCRTFPDRFTDKVTKSRRRGKIFIDYLRNAEGATAVAAYAVRARKNAPVATPIAWSELDQEVRFDHFNVRNVPARLERLKADPWDGFFEMRQAVTKAIMKKVGYS